MELKAVQEGAVILDGFGGHAETFAESGVPSDAIQTMEQVPKQEVGDRFQKVESEEMALGRSYKTLAVPESPSTREKLESQVPASESVSSSPQRENILRSSASLTSDLIEQPEEGTQLGRRFIPWTESKER